MPRVSINFVKIRLVYKQKKRAIFAMITFVAKKPETYQAMMIWDHYGVL